MQGLLSDLPLLGIFDLVHTAQQSGTLEVMCDIPYSVDFLEGEIVGGQLLDWQGAEALATCSLLATEGHFIFEPHRPTPTLVSGPYDHFMTEWARVNDEWQAACAYITSPSRHLLGELPQFETGNSVRAVAHSTGRPLIDVAQEAAEAVRSHRLQPQDQYAWLALSLPNASDLIPDHPLSLFADGQGTLSDLAEMTQELPSVRDYVYQALQAGLRFPGCGWVLRDLTWEMQFGAEEVF